MAADVVCFLASPLNDEQIRQEAIRFEQEFHLFSQCEKSSVSSLPCEVLICDGGLCLLWDLTNGGKNVPARWSGTWHWFGDGDSLAERSGFSLPNALDELKSYGVNLVLHSFPVQKDFSDFRAALNALDSFVSSSREEKNLDVSLYGALGGRRDHEWANVLEARAWANANLRKSVKMKFDPEFFLLKGEHSLHVRVGSSLSVLAFDEGTSFEIKGAVYEGVGTFLSPSHGLSNFSKDENVIINVSSCVLIEIEGGDFLSRKLNFPQDL
jgi:thiamine pyrophosphokinase